MPKKTDARKSAERRPLTEADHILIDSIRRAETRIREQEQTCAALSKQLSVERRELRDRWAELRNIAAPDANELFAESGRRAREHARMGGA